VDALIAGVIGVITGGGVSFVANYFLNVQRYKQDTKKQNSDHDHDLVKQDSEHKHDRQVFRRQKYEELTFRLIDFTNILKNISLQLSQLESGALIDTAEFDEKGAKIETLTILYFPELSTDCEYFLAISRQFLLSHSPNNNSSSINNRESMKIRFDKSFDQLYDKIKEHISDYT